MSGRIIFFFLQKRILINFCRENVTIDVSIILKNTTTSDRAKLIKIKIDGEERYLQQQSVKLFLVV